MPDNSNQRNMLIFVAVAFAMLTLYQVFVLEPNRKAAEAAKARTAASAAQPGPGGAPTATPTAFVPRAQAAAATPRVAIDTPALSGSVNLAGGRVDDLYLKRYRETVAPDSPPVELFRPAGAQYAYFAQTGWTGANLPGLPTDQTVWRLQSGGTLTPTTPVVLGYDNGAGLTFTRQIAVDQDFLFTITDTVVNRGAGPVTLTPYGSIQRQGLANPNGDAGVHTGAVGALGMSNQELRLKKWKGWKKEGEFGFPSKGGWLGVTDKYWMSALIPDQKDTLRGQFRVTTVGGVDVYDANFVAASRTIPVGMQVTETTRIFAGAKTVPLLEKYEGQLGVPRLVDAVDWGWWFFITKPMFWILEQLYKVMGNLGLALLGLTVIVRLVFFYPANLSYGSMAKMKKVQPEVDALRAQFKDDPAGMQREVMALYGKNKINPLMGCLPMLATIPVLYGLYKVLNVTIEMRHTPFFFLTRDLSARDPTNIWNLFGVLPWDPSHLPIIGHDGFLHLGIWALLYGFTTWLSQSMSPPAADPTQQKIMQFMPIIFTFVLAPLAVGLLIYYTWSNILTVLQQYVLMRKYQVENPIDQMLDRLKGRKAAG